MPTDITAFDFAAYYGQNPIEVWDRNRWTLRDRAITPLFYTNTLFTPYTRWQPLPEGAPEYVTSRELLPGHSNHNPIPLRAKFTTAAYLDSRERTLRADFHYGGKVQFDKYDELVNMWRANGEQGFIQGVLRQHLAYDVVAQTEKISRDMLLNYANVKTYAGNATDFATVGNTTAYLFDPSVLRDTKLRLAFRSMDALQRYGTYAQPLPGLNLNVVITTPGVMHSIWDAGLNYEILERLALLQNSALLNGAVLVYEGFAFLESFAATLWNAGAITKQVAVTEPIAAGDGAPDPNTTKVDDTYLVGQSGVKHYVQTSGFSSGDFVPGDFVTLHVARTNAYGVTDGVNVTDGFTMEMEVYAADHTTGRLVFRRPITADYINAFPYASLGGSAATGTAYAFVTKARHIHPSYLFGARGGCVFAIRRPIQFHTPPAFDDFESVVRFTWDMYGGPNKWDGDLWEIHFAAGSFGNRGPVTIA